MNGKEVNPRSQCQRIFRAGRESPRRTFTEVCQEMRKKKLKWKDQRLVKLAKVEILEHCQGQDVFRNHFSQKTHKVRRGRHAALMQRLNED